MAVLQAARQRPENLARRRQRLVDHIQSARNRVAQDTQAELDQHQQDIANKVHAMDRIREELRNIEAKIAGYNDEFRRLEAEIATVDDDLGKNRRSENQTKDSIMQIERQIKDKKFAFGPRTEDILKIIEANKTRFRSVPIGPLGMTISRIFRYLECFSLGDGRCSFEFGRRIECGFDR
jgi:chromosome segregation ATPase